MTNPTQPASGPSEEALHSIHEIETLTRVWVEESEVQKAAAIIDRHFAPLRARLAEAEKERDLLKSSGLGFTSTVSPSVEILRPDSVRDFNQAASALSGEAEISDLKTHLEEAQKERDELKACFRESMKTRLTIERECAQSTARAKLLEQLLNRAESLNAKLAAAFDAAKAFIDSHAADPDINDEMCRTYAIYQEKSAALALYREGGGRK